MIIFEMMKRNGINKFHPQYANYLFSMVVELGLEYLAIGYVVHLFFTLG